MIDLTYEEIFRDVQRFIQDESPDTLHIIKSEINKEYQRYAAAIDWPELRGFLNEGVSLVSGNAYMALPGDAAHVIQITDKTSDYTFINKTLVNMTRDRGQRIDTSATPYVYAELGIKPTKRPLSQDDTIEAQPNFSNSTGIQLRVKGLDSTNEQEVAENISLVVSTHTASSNTYREGWSINGLSVEHNITTGDISVREVTTTANELARIPQGQRSSSYYIVQFEAPSAVADSLNVIYKKKVTRLTENNDVPVIPVAQALIEKVRGNMRQYDRQYQQGALHQRMADDYVNQIRSERNLQRVEVRQMRPDFRGRRLNRAF